MRFDTRLRRIFFHLLAWTTFITYEVAMILIISPTRTIGWEHTGYYGINIFLFYFHAHVILTYAFIRQNRPILLLALIPLELVVYIGLEVCLETVLNLFRIEQIAISLNLQSVLSYIWRAVYFMGISTAYWLVLTTLDKNKKIVNLDVQRLQAEKEKAELEKNLILSRNALLQAQINPHLLFNTLNFIYNAVQDVSPKASDGVLLLSEVMHYGLQHLPEDGKTSLSSEVEHIEKYIALNQLRFSYPLQLQLHLTAKHAAHRIPPLLLLTFVENAFKHGDLTDPAFPATITLCCQNNRLHFSLKNKKRKQHARQGYGIGIRNARTRLTEAYGCDNYNLETQEDELWYSVELIIHQL